MSSSHICIFNTQMFENRTFLDLLQSHQIEQAQTKHFRRFLLCKHEFRVSQAEHLGLSHIFNRCTTGESECLLALGLGVGLEARWSHGNLIVSPEQQLQLIVTIELILAQHSRNLFTRLGALVARSFHQHFWCQSRAASHQ